MEYFGTNLDEHGHYTWDLSGDYMTKIGLLPKNTPFNPEELTNNLPKGNVVFCKDYAGFTILAIAGSCIDKRGGTKSVFWEKENISKEEMIERIMANKHSKTIINAMPFDVLFQHEP